MAALGVPVPGATPAGVLVHIIRRRACLGALVHAASYTSPRHTPAAGDASEGGSSPRRTHLPSVDRLHFVPSGAELTLRPALRLQGLRSRLSSRSEVSARGSGGFGFLVHAYGCDVQLCSSSDSAITPICRAMCQLWFLATPCRAADRQHYRRTAGASRLTVAPHSLLALIRERRSS